MKVFLGGTCNESAWREELIPMLKIDYFNPVVDDWNEEAYKNELRERKICDLCLYTITPEMAGVYSIAEVCWIQSTDVLNISFIVLSISNRVMKLHPSLIHFPQNLSMCIM